MQYMPKPYTPSFGDLAPRGKKMVLGGSALAIAGIFGPIVLLISGVVPLNAWTVVLGGIIAMCSWKTAGRKLLQPARQQQLKFHPRLSPLAPDWAHQLMRDLDHWDGQIDEAKQPSGTDRWPRTQPRPFDWGRD